MSSLLRTHLILTFPALLPAHVLSVEFAGGRPSPCGGPPSPYGAEVSEISLE